MLSSLVKARLQRRDCVPRIAADAADTLSRGVARVKASRVAGRSRNSAYSGRRSIGQRCPVPSTYHGRRVVAGMPVAATSASPSTRASGRGARHAKPRTRRKAQPEIPGQQVEQLVVVAQSVPADLGTAVDAVVAIDQRTPLLGLYAQRRREQRVLLEAVAATAAGDELGLQAFEIEPDRPAEEDVQVLERNVRRVRKMQCLQRGQRRLERTAVVDASQIGAEIEGPGGSGLGRHAGSLSARSATARKTSRRNRPRHTISAHIARMNSTATSRASSTVSSAPKKALATTRHTRSAAVTAARIEK